MDTKLRLIETEKTS
jgi:hypothetical protein